MGIALVVFLMVTLGLLGGSQLLSLYFHRDAKLVRQRIAQNFGKNQENDSKLALYHDLGHLDLNAATPDGTSTATPESDNAAPDLKSKLARLMAQNRANLTRRDVVLIVTILIIVMILGVSGGWLGGLWVGLLAAGAGIAAPIVIADIKRKARKEKYLKQLPNAFDLMARVIRSGQSVPQALNAVAETFEEPIAGEFANCHHQQNLGLRPEVTFQDLAQRSGIVELRIFAMAMLIQRQTGGNLSEVLERLAGVIRGRLQLRKQVRAWTAEGRLQGWTLSALPFLMFGVLMIINRRYVAVLFDHVSLLVATVGLMALGLLWIRKIVNFEY